MKSNYKRLGDYIEPCDEKNSANEPLELRGISNQKFFQKAKTNTIGIDLSTYRIVRTGQFAFNRATTRNGDKISIAICQEPDCIVSPSYRIFKSKDENILNSEYLMMWFRRPEFDRYARFKSHGSAHEFFDYDEMCEVELPIPSIEKQREIVKEYNTVVNRIQLNEQLNQKLEETAQAIYKQWFVDFEFPNEEGKPFKSSGGKLVWNDELDKEIPEGWGYEKLDNFVRLSQGQVINATTRHLVVKKGIPLLKITDLFNDTATMFIDAEKVDIKNIAIKEDLIYTRTGQTGFVFRNKEGVVYNNCFKIIPLENKLNKEYLYWFLKDDSVRRKMIDLAAGSAQTDLTHSAFFSFSIIEPNEHELNHFERLSKSIACSIEIKEIQIKQLIMLKDLLLAKMTKIEETTEKKMI